MINPEDYSVSPHFFCLLCVSLFASPSLLWLDRPGRMIKHHLFYQPMMAICCCVSSGFFCCIFNGVLHTLVSPLSLLLVPISALNHCGSLPFAFYVEFISLPASQTCSIFSTVFHASIQAWRESLQTAPVLSSRNQILQALCLTIKFQKEDWPGVSFAWRWSQYRNTVFCSGNSIRLFFFISW